MKATLAAAGLCLLSANGFAQGSYIICDTTEICICHDGTEAALTYTFVPCGPGQIISLVYCCGDFPEGTFVTVFNGPTVASPSQGTFMLASAFGAQQFNSTDPSGALSLRITVSPASALSCTGGDYPPWVIGLYAGTPQPPPPPPIPPPVCPLAAACCLSTATDEVSGQADLVFYYRDEALHCSSGAFTGSLELRAMNGRLIERQRVHGEQFVPIKASLVSGTYLVTLLGATESDSQLIVVP